MAASMHYRCNGSLLNTEKFPTSFNAFDSLAEAYMRNGDDELAVKNYEKPLQLNPNNENAKSMIEKTKNDGD